MNRSRRQSRSDVAGALRYHSEERFRLLVESVKDYAIFMLDCDGLVVSWNAGAERITGFATSEAVGAHHSRFYAEEARETRWPERELAIATREGRAEDEGWRYGKGGERFWAHTVITALRDTDGALRGYACIFRDLSDRRRHEEQLAQNEERLRALLESVRDYAIIMLDPQGTVVSWSEGAERIEGYRSEEIIGAHFSRLFPAEAVERGWPQHELQVAATEGHFEDENWRVRKDGSRFWANVVITALRDRNAKLIGFSKITRDLTARRHQEEALRESQERFRLLIESVKEYAIYMLDAEGIVMSWNTGAQTILGFESAEIVGQHFSRFYLPEEIHSGRPWQHLESARQAGRLQVEGLRVRQDGTAFSAQVLIAPVHDLDGRLRGYSHITHDLTRLRHMRALEDSGRRMNEFLAVLSHELRNPLAPLRHAAALLQRRGRGDRAPGDQAPGDRALEELTAVIDRQVAHLTRVVDDLLDVSRIAHGLITIVREPVQIGEVIARALELATPLIEQRRQRLQVASVDAALTVNGDRLRLTQVLSILLDNAARYTAEGGQIHLGVRQLDAQVELSVRDSGKGISPERLARIFDCFAQAERGVQAAGGIANTAGGLGVGLALARRLVELHGGGIGASSEGVARGSEFTVVLPLLAAGASVGPGTQTSTASGMPSVTSGGTPGRARRVLVVDDNVDSVTSLVMLLQAMGYQTDSAHDGVEALEAARRFAPDTVLLDIGLPRLDGYEVARRLRERAGEDCLLVALTGWGQQEDRERARAAGFDHHLVKPVDLQKLAGILGTEWPPAQLH